MHIVFLLQYHYKQSNTLGSYILFLIVTFGTEDSDLVIFSHYIDVESRDTGCGRLMV